MSLHFVCSPYPGEWFASLAARTRELLRLDSAIAIARQMFGVIVSRSAWDLVANRNEVGGELRRHTLLSFITSFVSDPSKRREIDLLVKEGSYVRAAYALGRTASRRLHTEYLRYCPHCAQTQTERFGEAYWLRLPQVRGIEFCPIHRIAYVNSPILRKNPGNLYTLRSVLKLDVPIRTPSTSQDLAQCSIGEAAGALLDAAPTYDSPWLIRGWRKILAEYGGGSGSRGFIRDMVDNLREHYGANYLATSGCGIGTNVEHSWVARFVRNPTQETDPLRHLLLLGLDGRNISDLATPPDPSPLQQLISKTRLMCENPACPNLGSKWRGETRLFRCPHTRRETVHMICHGCNQITALQVNEEAGSFHNWIVERGELWKISLRDFWTKPELSLREVARRLDADTAYYRSACGQTWISLPAQKSQNHPGHSYGGKRTPRRPASSGRTSNSLA